MMELVRLAEYAESKAKEDIAALLEKRSSMLEALTAMSAQPTCLSPLNHVLFSYMLHVLMSCVDV